MHAYFAPNQRQTSFKAIDKQYVQYISQGAQYLN